LRENTSYDVLIVKIGPSVRARHDPTNKVENKKAVLSQEIIARCGTVVHKAYT